MRTYYLLVSILPESILFATFCVSYFVTLQCCKCMKCSCYIQIGFRAGIDKHTFRVGVKLPLLRLVGDYDIDARVLVVPIKGSGTFTANASKYYFIIFIC